MKHVTFWLRVVAPVVLLGAGSAWAQQGMPPRGADPSGMNESNQTRELESEIEQYPGPNDGIRDDSAADTRIPERMQPGPKKLWTSPRPREAAAPAQRETANSASIDPSEVQRVFGSDARVIALGSLDVASITRLQVRLHELGHYKGTIDGIMGPQTRAALKAYARAQFALKQRLLNQDQLTTDLADQLGVQQGATSASSPAPTDDTGPSMRGDAPLLPPGGAPPPGSMAPLPTPSSAPSPSGNPASSTAPPRRGGATPTAPTPPSP